MERASNAAPQPQRRIIETGEVARYLVVSLVAFGVDVSTLLFLTKWVGLHYLVANVASFSFAVVVAYLGSVWWVFQRRRLFARHSEFLVFSVIGVGGLGINEAALWVGVEFILLPLIAAKLIATALSFSFNFLVRKRLLFS